MAAAKKGGLGKGIDSLIPNKVSATKTEAKNENVKNDKVIEGVLVNINKVEPNREQPRILMRMPCWNCPSQSNSLVCYSLCLYRTEKDIMKLLPASADGEQRNLPD